MDTHNVALEDALQLERMKNRFFEFVSNAIVEAILALEEKENLPGRVPRGELPSETPSPAR